MELRKWWKETGSRLVNKELIDLVGENIGYVPLRNLFEDICDIPVKKLEEILSDLVIDGLTLKRVTYQGGREELLLYIK